MAGSVATTALARSARGDWLEPLLLDKTARDDISAPTISPMR